MMRVQNQSEDVHTAVLVYGNTLRLAVLRALQSGTKSRSQISEELGTSQASIAHQLQFLRDYGLIEIETLSGRGRPMLHSLNHERAASLLETFLAYYRGEPTSEGPASPA